MPRKRTLILNFKNYEEILGRGAIGLAQAAESVAKEVGVEIVVAPPSSMIGLVASSVGIQVFSQKAEIGELGQSTGALIPESIKAAGASGTILNHSEARLSPVELRSLIARAKTAGLKVCICARTSGEVGKFARDSTEYLAIEPPELIGTGIAVSRARPWLIQQSVRAARAEAYGGTLLCGAGIVDAKDVARSVELGVEGVLVASSVVKAKDWVRKITQLSIALKSSEEIRK